MRKYQLNILLIVAAVIFTAVAALSMNRVVIATLFLALLAFVAVSEGALRRSRKGMADLVEAGLAERQRREEELAEMSAAVAAFGHAATQDPHSPLREIEEVSQSLRESHAHLLDDQGNQHLQGIRSAGQRMAQLTDDLADHSRLSRQEMHREGVDLSAAAREIAAELRKSQPERQVEFVVENDLVAEGDRQMLKLVLENLLDNSWRFTAKQAQARIEFGADRNGDKPAYYVRDNGAGFDNQQAELLFAPFQRWCNAGEHEGTGLGLASVRQIIRRHGGSVWAEAAAGEGATFYFTLNP